MDIIHSSWVSSVGSPIQIELSMCGTDLLNYGGHLARDFRERISLCKQIMSVLWGCRDHEGLDEFTEVRNQFNKLLHSHEVFWKQRAKTLWLKEWDMNSRIFMLPHQR